MTRDRLLAWASQGRPLHFATGLGFTVVMFVLALVGGDLRYWLGPVMNLLGVLGLALAHEQAPSGNGPRGDLPWSDFLRVNGGPWNGLWDVLAFLPAPALWLVLWAVLR